MGKQASQYDKIFKENIEAVIPSLMQSILGITAVSTEELPDDVQHTKERKPDVLKRIVDKEGTTFILQIEFQLVDESEMVYRMAEYNIMLARKYKLPVRQFVLFLGIGLPKMPLRYESDHLRYDFPLIVFADLDYHIFLKSDQPEEIVLGVLADFKGDSPERALKQIIQRIEETTDGDLALRRYFSQLRVLAQLRNLEQKFKAILMDSIAKYVDEERDVAYLVAEEKTKIKFVTNLLKKLNLTADQIADIAEVSVEFVERIKQNATLN